MEKAPPDHQTVLQELDRLLSEAPDEASREEILRLRNSLNTPEMIEMARAAKKSASQRSSDPVLEFHDPLLPSGTERTGHAWLHSHCWSAWSPARHAEAVAALEAMGIATPAGLWYHDTTAFRARSCA